MRHRPDQRVEPVGAAAVRQPVGAEIGQFVLQRRKAPGMADAALRTGEIDIIVDANPASAQRLSSDSTLVVTSFPASEYALIAWNTRRDPFTDPNVRRALTLAMDRGSIVDVVRGPYGSVSAGPVGPWHWTYDPEWEPYPFAPDSARALLEQAGWIDADEDGVREKNGVPLGFDLYFTPRQAWMDVATIVQANLADVGADVEPRARE